MNDNRYSNGKEQSWWQYLPTNCKVLCISALIGIAVVVSAAYFFKTSNPAKAGYFMVILCIFVVLVMAGYAAFVCVVNSLSCESERNCAKQTLVEAQETLAQAQEMHKQSAKLNAKTKQMIEDENARRQAEEDFLDTPDLDDDWEERAEELDQKKQAMAGEQQEEILPDSLTPEQLEQLRKELEEYDPEKDRDAVLNRRYARADGGKVVAILTRIHTGEIDVQLVKDILSGKASETPASPEENSGDQPKNPAALPAPQPQFLLEKKPDPPARRSIAEQLAELGLPESASTFLEYLLNVGNCPDYTGLKRPLRKQLDAFVEINAS